MLPTLLPALLPPPPADWKPGDPLYPPPPVRHPRTDRFGARLREEGTWRMTWTAQDAVPAPWTWLSGPHATGATR